MGRSWLGWKPANINCYSKKTVEFFVNTFEEIMILEEYKQTNFQQIQNLNQIEQQIEYLNKQISNYNLIFNKQTKIIQEQNTEIVNLQNIIIQNQNNMNSLKEKIQNLQADLMEKNRSLDQNLELSREQKQSLKNNILSLQGQIKNVRQQLSNQELFIDEKEAQIQNLIIQLQEKNQNIIEMQGLKTQEKKTYQQNIQQKIEQLNQLKQDIQSYQQNIDKLSITNEEQIQLLSKKEAKIQNLHQNVENNKKQINLLNKQIQEINKKLVEKNEEIKKNKSHLKLTKQNLNLELQGLKDSKKELQKKLNTQEFILINNQDKINNLMLQLEIKNQEIANITNLNQIEKNTLQNQIKDKMQNLEKMQEELNISRKNIIELTETIEEQQNIIDTQNEAITNLNENIAIKNNIINSLSDKITTIETELTNKQQELLTNAFLSEKDKNLLKKEIDSKTISINKLKEKLYSKENFITEAKKEIENLQNKLDQQEEKIITMNKLNEQEKNELKTNIQSKTELLASLENDLNENQQKIDQFKQTIKEQQNIITKKQEEIENLDQNIKQKNSDIISLGKEIKKISLELNKKTEELLQNKLLTNEQKRILNEEIKNSKKEIDNLKAKTKQKENFISRAEQKIENLENKLTQQTNKIAYSKLLNENDKFILRSNINNQFMSLNRLKTKLEKYRTDIEKHLDNTQIFNNFVLKVMDHSDSIHEKALNFIKETIKQKESQNTLELESAKNFLKKTDKLPTFEEVIGNKEVKEQLKESVLQLKNLNLYKHMGSDTSPKGILLYGPPGTGKTFLANAFARESGLPFFSITSSDFSHKYVGESPKLIKNLFEEARKQSPSVILIDECEVAFRKRNSEGLNSDHGNVITAFLSQMEGIYTDPQKPVFVIATTNFKDDIDDSILSRFNKLIEVDFWVEKDIIMFLDVMSKKYNLDIRSYKYLEQISKQIINSPKKELRTPRKIIELFDQATSIAVTKHEHLNIMPIDLQLSLDRIAQNKNIIDWDSHEHKKHDKDELFKTTKFKNTAIKHLFLDSIFMPNEKQYFQLIQNGYNKNKKFVYNVNNPEKILEIEIDQTNLEKINNFYSSPNPLPDDLLGFYFETNDKSKKIKEIKNIYNLESILHEGVKAKAKKIYFIWNIEKRKYNKQKMEQLLIKYKNKFNFLQSDNFLHNKLLEIIEISENNEIDIEKEILQYIEETKEKLIDDIYDKIKQDNEVKNEENYLHTKKEIRKKINEIFNQNDVFKSLTDIKTEIIFDIKRKIKKNKHDFLKETIEQFINEITFNNKIFNNTEIRTIKEKMIENIYNYFVTKEYYSLEDIQNKINEIKKTHTESLFETKWTQILQQLNIKYNLDKDKIIKTLEKITKTKLFYSNIKLNQIIEFLNEEAEKQIQILENNLNNKILENINRYILLDKDIHQRFSNQEIELINKGAFLIAKDELKKENIQEDEIYEKIKYFIKNYKMNTTKSDNVKDIFTIFIDNFYWLKFVLIIFFCKYFFQSKKSNKKDI
ncbi:MAG: AAA family ATPase [Phytoplasma sp.]|uniref:AAA family ATPase n=1 Tax=Phytoplasma sp. TaxID=2155 RepID=UPI002B40AB35|nr:AAA family ATPase [Phytoplasma sp.]WRH06856.1 MAG: AAA family ATPase [Phytoplasma sp.]